MKHTMKAILLAFVLTSGAVLATSCGTPFPLGCLYTNVMTPAGLGDGDMVYNRRGFASCYSFLGWFAGGNASLNIAAKAGEINHVSWASWHIENYFGIFGRFTTVVYGIGEKADPTVKSIADYE